MLRTQYPGSVVPLAMFISLSQSICITLSQSICFFSLSQSSCISISQRISISLSQSICISLFRLQNMGIAGILYAATNFKMYRLLVSQFELLLRPPQQSRPSKVVSTAGLEEQIMFVVFSYIISFFL